MIFFKFLNFIFGYIHIAISGKFPERLINIFSKNKIRLWNIVKTEKGYSANMKLRDFKKIRHFVFTTKTKVGITKKSGVPFILYRYRFRYGIIIGILLFVVMLCVMNLFVWSIEVKGNVSISKSEVVDTLEKLGMHTLMLKKNVDTNKLEVELRQEQKIIVWNQISIKGVKLIVDLKEGHTPPKIEEKTGPTNIVSDVDGIISDIKVYSGKAQVKKGDAVYKGKLLVSGLVDGKEATMLFPSYAQITAIVDITLENRVNYDFSDKFQSGKYYKRYSLQFFNFSVKLYLGDKNKFEQFDKDSYVNNLNIFSYETPFSLKEDIYRELVEADINLTPEMAKIACEVQYGEKERILLANENVVDSSVETVHDETGVTILGKYKVEKKIGKSEDIIN